MGCGPSTTAAPAAAVPELASKEIVAEVPGVAEASAEKAGEIVTAAVDAPAEKIEAVVDAAVDTSAEKTEAVVNAAVDTNDTIPTAVTEAVADGEADIHKTVDTASADEATVAAALSAEETPALPADGAAEVKSAEGATEGVLDGSAAQPLAAGAAAATTTGAAAATANVPEVNDPELRRLGGLILKAHMVFQQMDENDDGGISYGEMKAALGALEGSEADAETENRLSALFLEADKDGTGTISFIEFLKVVKVTVIKSEDQEVTIVSMGA